MSAAQKLPFGRSLNVVAQKRALDAINQTGRALPCTVASVSGAIITVNFEVTADRVLPKVDVPLFGPEYIRYPIQVGDKGCVFAADARLGAMSGLGVGVATLVQPTNLAALVFFPIGNKHFSQVDPDSVTIYGPNGVTLYDTGKNSTLTLTPNGIVCVGQSVISLQVGSSMFVVSPNSITMSAGGSSLMMDASGISIIAPLTNMTGDLNVEGDITAP